MKGDLISRNRLLQKIREDKEFLRKGLGKDAEYAYMSADSVMEKIRSAPDACDVDRIIGQINAATGIDGHVFYVDGRPVIYKEQAIEIIRKGGQQDE